MAAAVGRMAAKKLLASQFDKYKDKATAGPYDTLYATVPNPKRPGKFKKVKKQIPDYIPAHDAMILAKARKMAYRLDLSLFNFMGIRFGWSSVVGFVPAAGDVLDLLMALSLVWLCTKIEGGLDGFTLAIMLFNCAFDFAIGLVPLLGDVLDAAFKANTKNVRLLEEHLDRRYKPGAQNATGAHAGGNNSTSHHHHHQHQQPSKGRIPHSRTDHPTSPPATVYEDFSDGENDHFEHNKTNAGASYSSKSKGKSRNKTKNTNLHSKALPPTPQQQNTSSKPHRHRPSPNDPDIEAGDPHPDPPGKTSHSQSVLKKFFG